MAAHPKTKEKPLPTIWCVPDELWEKIEPILKEHDPPKKTGRSRIDQRAALDAIIFRLRSGCQWNRLRVSSPTIAPCTAPSSIGSILGSWIGSGRP
jgi:transposase